MPIILDLLMLLTVLFTKCSAAPQNRTEDFRGLQGEVNTIFNFPYLCTYRFHPEIGEAILLGSCTIYSKDRVIISVDTVDRLINLTTQFWFQRISQISVVAGSDILDSPGPKVSNDVQIRKVAHFYAGMIEKVSDEKILEDPVAFISTFQRNALGEVSCDVGVFLLDKPWDYSRLVLPIPLPTLDYDELSRQVLDAVNKLEDNPLIMVPCSIGGWGPIANNDIMVHDLVYIPWDDCRESICAHHPSACLEYPIVTAHHVCFKSRNYGDVCVYDQGAPLYCPWFKRGIFAILVRSFDCGLENMPAVYTLISYAAQFNKFIGTDQELSIEARN